MNVFDSLADLKIRTLRRKVLMSDSFDLSEIGLIVRLLDQEVERINSLGPKEDSPSSPDPDAQLRLCIAGQPPFGGLA